MPGWQTGSSALFLAFYRMASNGNSSPVMGWLGDPPRCASSSLMSQMTISMVPFSDRIRHPCAAMTGNRSARFRAAAIAQAIPGVMRRDLFQLWRRASGGSDSWSVGMHMLRKRFHFRCHGDGLRQFQQAYARPPQTLMSGCEFCLSSPSRQSDPGWSARPLHRGIRRHYRPSGGWALSGNRPEADYLLGKTTFSGSAGPD